MIRAASSRSAGEQAAALVSPIGRSQLSKKSAARWRQWRPCLKTCVAAALPIAEPSWPPSVLARPRRPEAKRFPCWDLHVLGRGVTQERFDSQRSPAATGFPLPGARWPLCPLRPSDSDPGIVPAMGSADLGIRMLRFFRVNRLPPGAARSPPSISTHYSRPGSRRRWGLDMDDCLAVRARFSWHASCGGPT